MIPLLKFSEIKKNPQVLIFDHDYKGHAAIVRYGDVVGFVVPVDRMKELLEKESKLESIEVA